MPDSSISVARKRDERATLGDTLAKAGTIASNESGESTKGSALTLTRAEATQVSMKRRAPRPK